MNKQTIKNLDLKKRTRPDDSTIQSDSPINSIIITIYFFYLLIV